MMIVRYTTSFCVRWLREVLRSYYIRNLQDRAFRNVLDAKVAYYDEKMSDDILDVIVNQTYYAGLVIQRGIKLLEQSLTVGVYFLIALIISPPLKLFTAVVHGGFTVFFRRVPESGYDIGDRVVVTNENARRLHRPEPRRFQTFGSSALG